MPTETGGTGANSYSYEFGGGGLIIDDTGVDIANDTLTISGLGAGFDLSWVSITENSDYSITITIDDGTTTDTVTILNQLDPTRTGIERVEFETASGVVGKALLGNGSYGNQSSLLAATSDPVDHVIYGFENSGAGHNWYEQLRGGAGNDRLYGGGGQDDLKGGDGDDWLIGGADNDRMYGGAGNDTYFYRSGDGADFISEGASSPDINTLVLENINPDTLDFQRSGAGFYITEGGSRIITVDYAHAIDVITFSGNGAGTNATNFMLGSNYAETLTGTADGDLIVGLKGNDVLQGMAGDDIIFGGDGADTIEGHEGDDTLSGGNGADSFVFREALGASSGIDHILAFSTDDTIIIDLIAHTGGQTTVTADQFVEGTAAADADDRIIYDAATGMFWADPDGSGAEAQILFGVIDDAPSFVTHSDFAII